MSKKIRLSSLDFDKIVTDPVPEVQPQESVTEPEVSAAESPVSGKKPELDYMAMNLDSSMQTAEVKNVKIYKPLHDMVHMLVVESSMKGVKTNLMGAVNRALYDFLLNFGKIKKPVMESLPRQEVVIEKSPGQRRISYLEDYTSEQLLELIEKCREEGSNLTIRSFRA